MASLIPNSSAVSRATMQARPTSSLIRATKRTSQAVLDWAGGADLTVTPFGGGSSVCGGVEPKRNGHQGAITIDLREMGKVIAVDKTSRAALIEGGAYGPALEAELRPHGLTLRHFPQSFEYSTLGGWIATRSGGHFATLLHPHRRFR